MVKILAESIISKDDLSNICIADSETISQTCSKFLSSNKSNNILEQTKIIRSANDTFDYKLLLLNNGIRILLVSDPTFNELSHDKLLEKRSRNDCLNEAQTSSGEDDDEEEEDNDDDDEENSIEEGLENSGEKTSAIAVAVMAGSFQDPEEFPGMAHMLEHLISMGSEDFPAENYMDDFLNSRGGNQNAFTENEHTCFQISVQRGFLGETINLIAKTLKAPLLRQSSIEREIKPIDSEFTEVSSDDQTRVEMLLSYLSNHDSNLHKFTWGNTDSLITFPKMKGLNTRDAVVEWYKKYYKSHHIVVVIQSQENMENLEKWSKVFEEIPKSLDYNESLSQTEICKIELPFHNNDRFNKLYIVESAEIGCRLVVSWIIRPIVDDYMRASFDFLATLIGYEGRGSLLSELKRNNLATSLHTNSTYFTFKINHYYSIFQVELELTEFGSKNLDFVVKLFGEYLSVMRKTGTQEYFFRENQSVALNSFNMSSELDALDNTERLAQHLLFFPIEHILIGRDLYYHYDPDDIDRMLDGFQLEKANFMLLGSDFRADVSIQEEPWMKIKFQEFDLPKEWKDLLFSGKSEAFFYPQPNRFIATNFDLMENIISVDSPERTWQGKPKRILENEFETIKIWYKPDFEFKLPKAKVYFHLMSPVIEGNCRDETICDIFCEMLLFELNEYCYDADLAQLSFSMSRTFNGIQLPVSGFNHKLPELVFLIFERLLNFEPSEMRLEMIKKEVLKYYNNKYYDQEKFGTDLRLKTLLEHYSTLADRSRIVSDINIDNVQDFKKRMLNSLSTEVLIQGNITLEQASNLIRQLGSILNSNITEKSGNFYEQVNFKILKLPLGKKKIRRLGLNPKSELNHVICFYQFHEFDFKSNAILSLFIDIIQESCFDHLRTKEGLGYSVGVNLNDTFGILGFNVYVTSPAKKYDCDFIEEKIENFVMNVCQKQLENEMTNEKYEEHLESLITRKGEKDVSLDEEVSRNIGEIISFNYYFSRREREIEELQSLKNNRKYFLDWLKDNVWNSEKNRQLTVEIVGLCDYSLRNVTDLNDHSVQTSLITEYFGDQIKEVCLKSSLVDSSEFILDLDEFKKVNQFYSRQPATINLVN